MVHEFGAEKPISSAKLAHFEYFTINFTVWSHIQSTSGDAFRAVLSISADLGHRKQRMRKNKG